MVTLQSLGYEGWATTPEYRVHDKKVEPDRASAMSDVDAKPNNLGSKRFLCNELPNGLTGHMVVIMLLTTQTKKITVVIWLRLLSFGWPLAPLDHSLVDRILVILVSHHRMFVPLVVGYF